MKDNLNPNFAQSVIVDYHFEELQKLKFSVYDIDDPRADIRKADFLGELECTLGQVCLMSFSLLITKAIL